MFVVCMACGFIIMIISRSEVPAPQPDPKALQQQAAGKRLQQTQAQVNEVRSLDNPVDNELLRY